MLCAAFRYHCGGCIETAWEGNREKSAHSHVPNWWLKPGILSSIFAPLPASFFLSWWKQSPSCSSKPCCMCQGLGRGRQKEIARRWEEKGSRGGQEKNHLYRYVTWLSLCANKRSWSEKRNVSQRMLCGGVIYSWSPSPIRHTWQWVLEWHLGGDFEVKSWNGLKDRLFENEPLLPWRILAEVSRNALVGTPCNQCKEKTDGLWGIPHLCNSSFPLPASVNFPDAARVSEESGTNSGAGSLLSACSFEDGYVFLFKMLCVILGYCKPVRFSNVQINPV